jgi:hypothetical protein
LTKASSTTSNSIVNIFKFSASSHEFACTRIASNKRIIVLFLKKCLEALQQ